MFVKSEFQKEKEARKLCKKYTWSVLRHFSVEQIGVTRRNAYTFLKLVMRADFDKIENVSVDPNTDVQI